MASPNVSVFPAGTPNVALWVDNSDAPNVYITQTPDGWCQVVGAVSGMIFTQTGGGVAAELSGLETFAQALANAGKN